MQGTAERARVEIEALATAGLDIPSFGQAAMDVLTRAVPFAVACLAPADPATRLITGNLKWGGVGDEHDDRWIFHEYEGPDPFNFEVVTGRPGGVGTAMVETGGDTNRSERFADLYHLWDVGDEARIALQTDGATWGFLRCSATARDRRSPARSRSISAACGRRWPSACAPEWSRLRPLSCCRRRRARSCWSSTERTRS